MAVVVVGYDPNAQGFSPFPEGPGYHFKIEAATIKPAKPPTGDKPTYPQLEIATECIASASGEKIGAKTRMWLTFSPKAVNFGLKALLEASLIQFDVGEMPGAEGMIPTLSFDPDLLVGTCFTATCKLEARLDGQGARENWRDFAVSEYNPYYDPNVHGADAQPAEGSEATEAAPAPAPTPAPAPARAAAPAVARPVQAAAPAAARPAGTVPPRAAGPRPGPRG